MAFATISFAFFTFFPHDIPKSVEPLLPLEFECGANSTTRTTPDGRFVGRINGNGGRQYFKGSAMPILLGSRKVFRVLASRQRIWRICVTRRSHCVLRDLQLDAKRLTAASDALILVGLQFNNSALQANRNRVGPIASAELGEYVCNVTLDGRFADGKPIRDLLVGVPGGN
jgi:hypothetical protein